MATQRNEIGKLLLRLPLRLHESLRLEASVTEKSLNALIVEKLARPFPSHALMSDPLSALVGELLAASGNGLVGIALFGSSARGEVTQRSSMEVLVALDESDTLGPALTRKWRETEREVAGQRAEIEFAPIPRLESGVSGFWAEVALDGIVLFERDFRLSRSLAGIRRHIASGRMVRRVVQDQHIGSTMTGSADASGGVLRSVLSRADLMRLPLNKALAGHGIKRAAARLKALDTFYQEECWMDVVREAQETVALALTALLRSHGVEPLRTHDLAAILVAERARLPQDADGDVDKLATISRGMLRDRELSFSGNDELAPLEFYARVDAERARADAGFVVRSVRRHVK